MAEPSHAAPFEAVVLPLEGLVVVALRGDADVTSLEDMDAGFDAAAGHPGPIVADLADLAFIDSTGLRGLIHAHSRISSQGRRFGVACPEQGPVHEVLVLTQMHRVMPVHPDRETAARALRG